MTSPRRLASSGCSRRFRASNYSVLLVIGITIIAQIPLVAIIGIKVRYVLMGMSKLVQQYQCG